MNSSLKNTNGPCNYFRTTNDSNSCVVIGFIISQGNSFWKRSPETETVNIRGFSFPGEFPSVHVTRLFFRQIG